MVNVALEPYQTEIVQSPLAGKIFLEGPAGTGKTTVGVARMVQLLEKGISGEHILVLVPQRTLATPYYEVRRSPHIASGGLVDIATIGGLAQRIVDLFWPLAAEDAGFAKPNQDPIFLTLETAQYYMARIVHPLIEEENYFDAITIDPNRLYSQILDNLSKSAAVGFPYTEIGERLKAAWVGEPAQAHAYDEAQLCASRFRRYCLAHNLLDFSLQLEVFLDFLWPHPLCREYLLWHYPHLIVDNVEENPPVAYDLLRTWLPACESGLLIWDHDAGYRSFLGADPETLYELKDLCETHVGFSASFTTSRALGTLAERLARALRRGPGIEPASLFSFLETDAKRGLGHSSSVVRETPAPYQVENSAAEAGMYVEPQSNNVEAGDTADIRTALHYAYHRYHPEMLDWVASQVATLVYDEKIIPGEIVILAPYLTDALRFSLINRLAQHDIPTRSHRPSRALREEPGTHCLLTLAALAHPHWGFIPTHYDITYALMQALADLDLVRARLLTDVLYRIQEGHPELQSFEQLNPDMQARITYLLGGRYETLRGWIHDHVTETMRGEHMALDHFLSRLFGEVLAQPGFGFHRDLDAGRVAANLIESVRKFRWVIDEDLEEGRSLGREYLHMVREGVVAAQYIRSWAIQPEEAVLLAPAYTFLMSNRPVAVQFWLNVGGRGWWERLYQPLTHPYVLSRHWRKGQPWTDEYEFEVRQNALYRLVQGLIRRCRHAIYLGLSELGEQGFEQQGPLLRAIQRVLRESRGGV